jgi:hypothetical protein
VGLFLRQLLNVFSNCFLVTMVCLFTCMLYNTKYKILIIIYSILLFTIFYSIYSLPEID